MAQVIMLKHPQTGLTKKGFVGFSWTTFFFGGFPALFRGDILVGVLSMLIGWFTFGVGQIIWAFLYNKHFTTKLIEQGYVLADSEERNTYARGKLGIAPAAAGQLPV